MQTIPTVEITVSSIIEDLNKGLTWYQKDDMGFGSIQDKYEANDIQIATIKQHPKLANQITAKFIFQIVDDTVDGYVPKEQKNAVPPVIEEEKQGTPVNEHKYIPSLPEPPQLMEEGARPVGGYTSDFQENVNFEMENGLPGDNQTYIM